MNIHKNARLTPHGRERMVRMMLSGQTPEAVARAAGVCPRTARKWFERYKADGLGGLQDRSSRPHRLRQPTPMKTVETIMALRRQRWTGKHIALGNSMRKLSPAVFAMRQWNSASLGSITLWRWAPKAAMVPSSSAPMRRL